MTNQEAIQKWSDWQNLGAQMCCPRCGLWNMDDTLAHNATSRREDIAICSPCGTAEALEDFNKSGKMTLGEWFAARTFGIGGRRLMETEDGFILSKVCIKSDLHITHEDIDDIMCAALEGGITYWCGDAEAVGGYLGDGADEQISKGGKLSLYDAEDDRFHMLNLEKFMDGIALSIINGYAKDWLETRYTRDNDWLRSGAKIDAGMVDAEAANIIIQFALFGDIIYG